jgi:hypothetical protein
LVSMWQHDHKLKSKFPQLLSAKNRVARQRWQGRMK